MSAALPLLSPLVTRILELSGFPPELKTRDIQAVFAKWEDDRGGFKIKWVDDTTALVIFADPAVAKRAYLTSIMSPPPLLMTSAGVMARIRPYDGDDANNVIASVQNRTRSRSSLAAVQATPAYGGGTMMQANGSLGAGSDNDASTSSNGAATSPPVARSALQAKQDNGSNDAMGSLRGHRRKPSGSNAGNLPAKPLAAALYDAANGGPSPAYHLANALAMENRSLSSTSTGSSNGAPAPGNASNAERHSPLPARPPPQLHAAVNGKA